MTSPNSTHTAAAIALALAVAWLSILNGGVEPASSAPVFAAILAITCALLLPGSKRHLGMAIPWPVIAIAALPWLQLVPLGAARAWLWPAWRQGLDPVFAVLGITAPTAVSIYPYATLLGAIVLAGCCAIFLVALAAAWQSDCAVLTLAAALVTLAVAEAVIGLLQAFSDPHSTAASGNAFPIARGTFANRNHFAVLLEAGLCLALGLGALARGVHSPFGNDGWRRLARCACLLAAALCGAGIAASGSRMGIAIAFAAALGASLLFARNRRMLSLAPLSLAVLLLVAVFSVPGIGHGFQKLVEDGGDPGRSAIWSDASAAVARHLMTGSGLGTFAFAFQRSSVYFPRSTIDHAHNDGLEFAVELGLPGALFAGASIAGVLLGCLRRVRRPGRGARSRCDQPDVSAGGSPDSSAGSPNPLLTAFLLAAAAILVHSTADFPLQIPALAALLAVLLGGAAGMAAREERLVPVAPATRVLTAVGCCALAVVAGAVASGRLSSWDAGRLFQRAERELLEGRLSDAGDGFQAAIAANPYAAPAWQKLAEISEINGDKRRARQLLEIATHLEPFTFRTEWQAAESLLRNQDWDEAAARLGALAAAIPDAHPAIFHAAFEAGMPPALIESDVVPGDAWAAWLRSLLDRDAWEEFDQSLSMGRGAAIGASPLELRYLFDRLFQKGQDRLMLLLWKAIRKDACSELSPGLPTIDLRPTRSQSDCAPRAAGDIVLAAAAPTRAGADFASGSPSFNSGFGFQWVAPSFPNARLRFCAVQPGSNFVELDFSAAPQEEMVLLTRYVPVAAATSYVLAAQCQREHAAGETIRVEVWSAKRLLGNSTSLRNSAPGQIEVSFRTDGSEEVVQLRVVGRGALRGTATPAKFRLGAFRMSVTQRNMPRQKATPAGRSPRQYRAKQPAGG